MASESNTQPIEEKVIGLLDELIPLTQHSDLTLYHYGYSPSRSTLYLEILPRSSSNWASTAYRFANQPNMKYDRDASVYGIDGQPRVSSDGNVWVRFKQPFLENSNVALQISSNQPSHHDAEMQLMKYYGLFQERQGLEPAEVFQKFL